LDPSVFEFLRTVLLLQGEPGEEEKGTREHIALRFQQLTGPVMAKAVEDTAFYRYNRLLCLNEVGGDPGLFGATIDDFHSRNAERLRSWPLSLVATSTHDTKRGVDAGARIAVLSEMPVDWGLAVRRWSRRNDHLHTLVDGVPAPNRRDEYTLYQALVGAWPYDREPLAQREPFIKRTCAFMEKAIREAKQETSWTRQNATYEAATLRFVTEALRDDGFVADLDGFCERLVVPAACNGLSGKLLKVCSPGVPDTYQGTELWNQVYVDPDNRGSVDFARRHALLDEIEAGRSEPLGLAQRLLDHWRDGAVKMYVQYVALSTRAAFREVFRQADYEPLHGGEHVVAFVRRTRGAAVVVVAPRLVYRLTGGSGAWPVGTVWGDQKLALPSGAYREAFTGTRLVCSRGRLPLAEILAHFPVALLVRE
jgi:(1->4)-alpha-D-glucan 1-alpha-D-glucosylmutase